MALAHAPRQPRRQELAPSLSCPLPGPGRGWPLWPDSPSRVSPLPALTLWVITSWFQLGHTHQVGVLNPDGEGP